MRFDSLIDRLFDWCCHCDGIQDLTGATELATRVLQLKPQSFEAYHARARAERDAR